MLGTMTTLQLTSVTEMKTGAARLLKKVRDTRRPVVITQNGEGQAVLIDIRSYNELQESLAMLTLVRLSEGSLEQGTVSHDNVAREFRARAKARRTQK